MKENDIELATFANGCFWCTEAVFLRLEGVENVISGFTGGKIKNPPYREVVEGRTGHAEGIQIEFDPTKIRYKELLMVFFYTHDPTTLNRQGYDVGTQYRSEIFYHNPEQKNTAEKVIADLNKEMFDGKIVTKISEASAFYEAEEEHQKFYDRHPEFGYCKIIIDPKLQKLKAYFSDKLKPISQ